MLVVVAVHLGVGALSDETRLVESKVGGASVSPSQWNLVLLHVIFGNWMLVRAKWWRVRHLENKIGVEYSRNDLC